MSIGLILCILALIVCVVLEVKFKLPLGMTTMFCAFVIGVGVMGMNANAIVGAFPTSTVFTIILATGFYGLLSSTGIMPIIGKRMLRSVHGEVKLIPVVGAVAIGLVGMVAGMQVPYTIGPVLIALLIEAGMSPLIIPLLMAYAVQFGSNNPWTSVGGNIVVGLLRDLGFENAVDGAIAIWFNVALACLIVLVVAYFALRCHKIRKVAVSSDEDLSMTPVQKKATVLFVASIIVLLVPALIAKIFPGVQVLKFLSDICSTNIVLTFGIVLAIALKIGTVRDAMSRVPMPVIIMIAGVTMLVFVADQAGLSEVISTAVAGNVPVFLIPAVFVFLSSVMSYVTAVWSIVPVLYPIAIAVAGAAGLNPIVLLSCINVGATISCCSPVSTMGAVCLSVMPNELQDKLSKQMFISAIVASLLTTLLAVFGAFNLIPNLICG